MRTIGLLGDGASHADGEAMDEFLERDGAGFVRVEDLKQAAYQGIGFSAVLVGDESSMGEEKLADLMVLRNVEGGLERLPIDRNMEHYLCVS